MTASSKKRKAEPSSETQEEVATEVAAVGEGPPPTKKSFTNQEDQGDAVAGDDQDKVKTGEDEEEAGTGTDAKGVVKEETSQNDLSNGNGGDRQDSSVKEEGASTLNGDKEEGNVNSEQQQQEEQEAAGVVTDAKGAQEEEEEKETPKDDNVVNSGNHEGQVENKDTKVPSSSFSSSSSGQPEATLEVPPPATVEESTTAQPAVVQEPSTADNVPVLPPGVPMGVPMALPINASVDTTPAPLDNPNPSFTSAAVGNRSNGNANAPPARLAMQTNTSNPTTTTTTATTSTANTDANILTEKENIPVQYVGRIIGKGGEQIRDLQARSACKVDVDQNVPHGAPRVITYQGTRDKIDFAKSLVAMLCKDNWKTVELPLGFASRAQLQVPSGVIGKIIGRGGEMIKELQSKSYAKIQVDHSGGGDVSYRAVTVTGNELSVRRAEEMINLIIANPLADASTAVDMLIREKAQGTSEWGSGPPYVTMPNNGFGMPPSSMAMGSGGGGSMVGGYGQQQQQPMQYGSYPGYGQQLQQQAPPTGQSSYGHYGSTASRSGGSGGVESDIFYAGKSYMGRIIGQKGVTINDLQKRSGCDIQINQNVPMGQDCEVHIKGSRQGIELAKQMLNDILQMGPNHPYAGGQGVGGGGGGYPQPTGYMQQQTAYGQTQPQYQQHYGQQAQYPMNPNQYGYTQQTQLQQPTSQYGAPYGSGQTYGYGQQPPTQLGYQQPVVPAAYSPWKTATSPDGQIYYYNEKTNETTWDKPAGMP